MQTAGQRLGSFRNRTPIHCVYRFSGVGIRKWLRGICVLFLYVAMFAAPSGAEPLRVVSYNLQGMRPDSNWQVRMFFILQRLRELDPDIILLQEVCQDMDGDGSDNQARTIAEDLGEHFGREYHWSFCQSHVGWEQFDEGVGIVSRWPVVEESCQPLVNGTFPRRVAWQRIQTPYGEVQAFSTHLEHMSNQGSVRLQQARQARDFVLGKLATWPESAAILGGDFNTTPGTAPILVFTAAGPDSVFADAWASANPGQPGYTIPAEAATSRIDFQFTRHNGQPWVPDSCRVVMTRTYDGTHTLSDHLGVLSVYDLSATDVSPSVRPAGTFHLSEPWPNPFNPGTRFELSLEHPAARVEVAVYDLLGRPVEKLHQGALSAGVHAFTWEGTSHPAGLYLIVAEQGGQRQVRRALWLP